MFSRNGNVALRDFWRYSPGPANTWEKISAGGAAPGCLQVISNTCGTKYHL